MEAWFIVTVSLCFAILLKNIFNLLFSGEKIRLPPGPPSIPVIGGFLWIRRSFAEIEPLLRELKLKYGPFISLRIGTRPAIFVSSRSLAHRALVQKGVVFSDRPRAVATSRALNRNGCNISSAGYGATWRILRRNLTSEILHPSRVKSYGRARRWVLGILIERLLLNSKSGAVAVRVMDDFQYAMFSLLVLMCFGDRLDEKKVKQIEKVQRDILLSLGRFGVLNFWPRFGKLVFRNRWKQLFRLVKNQEDVLIPLIRDRIRAIKEEKEKNGKLKTNSLDNGEERVMAYVDTLVDLQLPDEKRNLNDGEMLSLCSEFLNGGTDTTSTALQWLMANLVKHPRIQAKLYEEITGIVGPPPPTSQSITGETENGKQSLVVVKEEELQRMPFLKAVILEGLRRHPPGHFVLPHTVTEDTELDGYVVPKNATINFMVAEMGWDPDVWKDPLEFKPERFLTSNINGEGGGGESFDLTGNREIKMMPFGAGRRICPGSGLALLHLEYFVANLVWYFEWTAVAGDGIDLSEKQEFTIVMKNPLQAKITPRVK